MRPTRAPNLLAYIGVMWLGTTLVSPASADHQLHEPSQASTQVPTVPARTSQPGKLELEKAIAAQLIVASDLGVPVRRVHDQVNKVARAIGMQELMRPVGCTTFEILQCTFRMGETIFGIGQANLPDGNAKEFSLLFSNPGQHKAESVRALAVYAVMISVFSPEVLRAKRGELVGRLVQRTFDQGEHTETVGTLVYNMTKSQMGLMLTIAPSARLQ